LSGKPVEQIPDPVRNDVEQLQKYFCSVIVSARP